MKIVSKSLRGLSCLLALVVGLVSVIVSSSSNNLFAVKKVDAVVPPKKPLSSYMLFCADVRPTYAKKCKGVTEVAKAIGAAWKEVGDEEKAKYQKMADEDKTRYEKEVAAFEKAGGVIPKRKKKSVAASDEPKKAKAPRAPSAYCLYMKDHLSEAFKALPEGAPRAQAMATVAGQWKALSDNEKEPYSTKAGKLKAELTV